MLGDKAQNNGLGISLLERLHDLYSKMLLSSTQCHSVTLLTNYHCHNGILMLPSSLYYQSTLLCRVKDYEAHHLSPFPLNFVCSDISDSDKPTVGTNEVEAEVLLKEVQKYFTKWPKHWGKEERSKVCIMSPSADQVYLKLFMKSCEYIIFLHNSVPFSEIKLRRIRI